MAKRTSGKRKRVSGKKRAQEHKSGFDRTAINVPDGCDLFSLGKEGTKRIEIVPFTAGADNPYADKGELHYERTFFTHRGIGASEDTYICPKKTWGKKCPICEAKAKLSQDPDADEDAVKALKWSERQLFNVFDHGDPDKGLQLWDFTFHWFGKLLDARIKNQEEDDEYEFFADPEDGFTLRLTIEESDFAKGKFEVSAIDFKARKKPLDEELLEAALILDDLLIEVPYDKLSDIFLQVDGPDEKTGDDDDDDDEPAKKPRTRKPKPSSTTTKKGGGKKPPKKEPEPEEDEDDESFDADADGDFEEDEPDADEDAGDDSDGDDDGDDDWDDDEGDGDGDDSDSDDDGDDDDPDGDAADETDDDDDDDWDDDDDVPFEEDDDEEPDEEPAPKKSRSRSSKSSSKKGKASGSTKKPSRSRSRSSK